MSDSLATGHEISRLLREKKERLSYSSNAISGPYPEPDQSSPQKISNIFRRVRKIAKCLVSPCLPARPSISAILRKRFKKKALTFDQNCCQTAHFYSNGQQESKYRAMASEKLRRVDW